MRTTYLHWNYSKFYVWVNFHFDGKVHCCWNEMKEEGKKSEPHSSHSSVVDVYFIDFRHTNLAAAKINYNSIEWLRCVVIARRASCAVRCAIFTLPGMLFSSIQLLPFPVDRFFISSSILFGCVLRALGPYLVVEARMLQAILAVLDAVD